MKHLTLLILALVSTMAVVAQTTSDSSAEKPGVQVSFIYPMGTSGSNSINETQQVSINILAGVNGAIEGIEVGGVANVTKGAVTGAQLSGFINLVNDSLEGMQFAGFSNTVRGNASGLQGAGFANAVIGDFQGAQFSGFASYIGGSNSGVQASGFGNATLGMTTGAQIAGFANYSSGLKGAQIAGFANSNIGNAHGNQIAGFANVTTGTIEGMQIAGFVNVAKNVKGMQLGFLNIADSVDGLSIGFLSFVKSGYHTFEISSNETFETNLTFKTGVPKFYNAFSAGIHWNKSNTVWALGYGIGTKHDLGKNLAFSADLKTYAVHPDGIEQDDWESFNKLELSVSRKLGSKVEVFAGGSLNMWVSNKETSRNDYLKWTDNQGKTGDNFWVLYPGFQAGLRLF
jgi:hypothetical protein